jgi:hypothetical protein
MLKRRQQGVLRQLLRQRHVTQHSRQSGDEPGLLNPPGGENCVMDIAGGHG